MLISVIIPYRTGLPVGQMPSSDELLWMNSDRGIGEQRIAGAKQANNYWLAFVDADGNYPKNYIALIKAALASGKYPNGFFCQRSGRLWATKSEGGLVVRKDLFLERTYNFVPDHRDDVATLFQDLPINRAIQYQHAITTGEKVVLLTVGTIGTGLGLLYAATRKR